jgi:hypothetical protein
LPNLAQVSQASGLSQSDIGTVLQQCTATLLSALAGAGVDIKPIASLASCPVKYVSQKDLQTACSM